MKNFSKIILSIALVLFSLSFNIFGQQESNEAIISNIEFKVISQRRLTKDEQKDSPTFNIVIRVRLTNSSKQYVQFVVFNTGENTYISPLGLQYSRKIGETDWKRQSPNNTFEGLRYRNLTLLPNMSIEYDIASASFENIEKRFSVSLKLENNNKRFEVFSDIIPPITER